MRGRGPAVWGRSYSGAGRTCGGRLEEEPWENLEEHRRGAWRGAGEGGAVLLARGSAWPDTTGRGLFGPRVCRSSVFMPNLPVE